MRSIVMPGSLMSARNMVARPSPSPPSTLAMMIAKAAPCAPVISHFSPSMTQELPSRRAVVFSMPGSEPAPGDGLRHAEAGARRAGRERPQEALALLGRRDLVEQVACCPRRAPRNGARSARASNSRPPRTPPPARHATAPARRNPSATCGAKTPACAREVVQLDRAARRTGRASPSADRSRRARPSRARRRSTRSASSASSGGTVKFMVPAGGGVVDIQSSGSAARSAA